MQATCEKPITREHYIAVPVSSLVPEKPCGVSLYTSNSPDDEMRLFRGSEFPITHEDLEHLAAEGRTKLYVSAAEHRGYQQYLREVLDDVLHDESRGVQQRFETLNEVVRDVLAEAFSKASLEEKVRRAEQMGHNIVDLICRKEVVVTAFCRVLYHDYHTFTHSANTAYYAVMLAMTLGLESKAELSRIATGALLHDLGKLQISDSLLTKPGKLNDREFETVQCHPIIGFRELCEREDLNYGQLMLVYQHHERIDGNGYPVRVSGSEIHDWARICTVADVFEALTSNRPYRARMSFEEAFKIMDRLSDTAFERRVYECWKATIRKR